MMDSRSITLDGRFVRLEPLNSSHLDSFLEAGAEWNFTPDFVRDGIAAALRRRDEGTAIPFATVCKLSQRIAGGISFLQIDKENRRLEIGSTWLGQPWRRTAVNTEAKLLMLCHAFEVMGCARVEFRANSLNERSRAALMRIGAYEEGILRNYEIGPDGINIHIVIYSILDSEWSGIKDRLQRLLTDRHESGYPAAAGWPTQ